MVESRAVILTEAGFDLPGSGDVPDSEPVRLLRLARSGDTIAFERLMVLYERQVFRTAFRLLGNVNDAQDAAQEVFFRLHRNLKRIDEAHGCSSWLYRVTVNVCRDILRSRGRRATLPLEGQPEPSGAPDADGQIDRAGELRVVAQALERLPEKERAAVVLRDIEGLSTREVAEILGNSEQTVRSQISQARAKIRAFAERVLRRRI